MDIVFVASIAVIAPDPAQSRKLYVDALGLPLAAAEGSEYWHSEQLAGTKSFGIWPLREAAQACFGQPEWPAHLPAPQASIEFEVADAHAVQAAAQELEARGFALLHAPREEPWGQTVARLLSAESLIVGISFAPSLHDNSAHESQASASMAVAQADPLAARAQLPPTRETPIAGHRGDDPHPGECEGGGHERKRGTAGQSPTVCLCKSRARRGFAARMLLFVAGVCRASA